MNKKSIEYDTLYMIIGGYMESKMENRKQRNSYTHVIRFFCTHRESFSSLLLVNAIALDNECCYIVQHNININIQYTFIQFYIEHGHRNNKTWTK